MGAQATGQLVTTLRDESGAVRELDRTPFRTLISARGATVVATVDGVRLGVPVIVSERRSSTVPSTLLRLAGTPDVSSRSVRENGQTHIIQVTRKHVGGPIVEIRHSINGDLAYVTTNEWRGNAGGWMLGRSVLAQYRSGSIVGEVITEVSDVEVIAASTSDVLLDRFKVVASSVGKLLLPAEAHAQDGIDCEAELIALAATGWGAHIACAGGVLLFTPTCGAAMLAYAGASWFLADCIEESEV